MGDERPFLYLTDVSQSYAVLIIIALGQLSFLCLLKTINNQQRFVREMTSENSWEKRYDHDSFILGTALLYTLRSIRHNIVGSLVSTVILKGLALLPDASFGLVLSSRELWWNSFDIFGSGKKKQS